MARKLAPRKMRHYAYDEETDKLVLVAEHTAVQVSSKDLPPHVLKHLKELALPPKRTRKRKSA